MPQTVAQNQLEQMFDRPHVVEDPVRCGFHRAIVRPPDGFAGRLSRRGRMTEMVAAVYANATRAAPRQLLGGAKPNT
jgi:hypothetical protein